MKRESVGESGQQLSPRKPAPLWLLIPALVAVVLALPCFRFTYLFDDYPFLQRVQPFHAAILLPDPQSIFYRPLSREIYFGLLSIWSPGSATLGHWLNLLILAVVVVLLARFARRVAGMRAGFFAGFMFASLGALPLLVGWVCGIQDLLAMAFILGALNLQLSNRTMLACGSFTLALLSKETAIAVLPALVGLEWFLGRRPHGALRRSVTYGVVALGWLVIHPGIRIFGRDFMASRGDAEPDGRGGLARGCASLAVAPAHAPHRDRNGLRLEDLSALLNPRGSSAPAYLGAGTALGPVLFVHSGFGRRSWARIRSLPNALQVGIWRAGPLLMFGALVPRRRDSSRASE